MLLDLFEPLIMASHLETKVKERYASAAHQTEAALCCPVQYDKSLLEVIPAEVIEKDYGCGDPSQYLREGETVLDLGSGTGKICFMAAQKVGPHGKVIGVDMTDDMLEVARRHAPTVAERIGYQNVVFKKGRIQDLSLDLELWNAQLSKQPIQSSEAFLEALKHADTLRREQPMIASDSVDVVVSNCVLNLVESDQKKSLFREIHRVIRQGGRAVISDIVSDEPVPEALRQDAHLWSGCISGALSQTEFLEGFREAGFHGITLLKRDDQPWQTVEGIEFRSVTVEAFKSGQGPRLERHQAVIYKGPFASVTDDGGHTYLRGQPMAVCHQTFERMGLKPYRNLFERIEPSDPVLAEKASAFHGSPMQIREPKELKQTMSGSCSDNSSDSCCC